VQNSGALTLHRLAGPFALGDRRRVSSAAPSRATIRPPNSATLRGGCKGGLDLIVPTESAFHPMIAARSRPCHRATKYRGYHRRRGKRGRPRHEAFPPVSTEERAGNLIGECVVPAPRTCAPMSTFDLESRLSKLDGVLAARKRYRDRASVHIMVAFPQSCVMRCTGVLDLLDAAVRSG
jgi:hypothetical protein